MSITQAVLSLGERVVSGQCIMVGDTHEVR